jgi:hypothetical protein
LLSAAAPRLLLLRSFLSSEEAGYLAALAEAAGLEPSRVVAPGGGVSAARTSRGTWLTKLRGKDATVDAVEARLAAASGLPQAFGEGLHVLEYEAGQKYDPHLDACVRLGGGGGGEQGKAQSEDCQGFLRRARGPACGAGAGGATCGDRLATMVMMLHAPEEGGETVFPAAASAVLPADALSAGAADGAAAGNATAEAEPGAIRASTGPCDAPGVFKIRPAVGDALLFWNYLPRADLPSGVDHETYARSGTWADGSADTEAALDPGALHGGCPVRRGRKVIMTRWWRASALH